MVDIALKYTMNEATCPLCNKSCGPYRPGAEVYHMSCLEARFKPLREKWKKEREDARNSL